MKGLIAIAEGDVVEVARAVWGDMLGLSLDGPDPAAQLPDGPVLRATVVIRAALDVVVTLEVGEEAGLALAAAMFGTEPGDLGPGELVDAVGELANMVGGNLKLLVAPPAALTLPAVSDDAEAGPPPGTTQLLRVPFRFAGGVLHLVVRVGDPAADPAADTLTNPDHPTPGATTDITTDRSVA